MKCISSSWNTHSPINSIDPVEIHTSSSKLHPPPIEMLPPVEISPSFEMHPIQKIDLGCSCGNLDTGTVFVIMSIAHAQSIFMPINVRPVYCYHSSFVSYARPSGLLARSQVSICQVATSSGSKRDPKWQVMAVSPSSAVVPRSGTCSPSNSRFTSPPTVSPMETRRGPSYSAPAELRRTSY